MIAPHLRTFDYPQFKNRVLEKTERCFEDCKSQTKNKLEALASLQRGKEIGCKGLR